MNVQSAPEIASPVVVMPTAKPLAQAPLFSGNALLAGIGPEICDRILARLESVTFGPDEMIFAEDEPGDCLYLIAEGSVKISKRGRGGQQETLTYLLVNDYFGEMALVDSGKRSAQASTVGKTVLGRMDRATWDLLLQLAPQQVMGNFTHSVTQRLRRNNQHFIEQVMRSERLSLLGTTISSIVHDMNNPIMSILGASQVILSNVNDPLTNQMARLIREAVDKMETMTRELIDFSRGDTKLKLQLVSVPELVRQLEPDFTKCRVACDVQIDVGFDGSVRIDRHRMLRVFGNLIRNAREAMKADQPNVLRFSVHAVESRLRFEVSDTGHGIKSDILPQIFEPFMTHGKSNGTGLGLAISKAVIDAHSGTIAVESNDTGTTFRIEIPLPAEKES
jgi:signal transduction histidine kinase